MTTCFLMLALAVILVTCGSRVFPAHEVKRAVSGVDYPFAVRAARQRVMPHLHYAVDMRHVDNEHGTVELSFYFIKEQGDTLLWVECVEKVPLSLVDTAWCRRWYYYDYDR